MIIFSMFKSVATGVLDITKRQAALNVIFIILNLSTDFSNTLLGMKKPNPTPDITKMLLFRNLTMDISFVSRLP